MRGKPLLALAERPATSQLEPNLTQKLQLGSGLAEHTTKEKNGTNTVKCDLY